jgi:Protein of unknown function (DUF2997)
MADKQELEFNIDEEGNVTIKVIGGSGASCLDLTKGIEEALGLVTDRQKTSEFYEQEVKTEGTIEQGGE